MQAFKVILLVACLAAAATATSCSGDECEMCKEGVEKMKESLPRVEKAMIGQCKKIHDTKLERECIAKAKEFIDKLSKVSAEQICHQFKLCRPAKPFELDHSDQCTFALCEPCELMALWIKLWARPARYPLRVMCKFYGLPLVVRECEKAIDYIVDNLDHKSSAEICREIGLCRRN